MVYKKAGQKSDQRGKPQRRPRSGRMHMRRKVCKFCVGRVDYIDFKAANVLRNYMTTRGKIIARRITGNCARHQRQLTLAIKRAQNIALLPVKEG